MINVQTQKVDATPSSGAKTVVLLLAGATTSLIALTVAPGEIQTLKEPLRSHINLVSTPSIALDPVTYIDSNSAIENDNDQYLEQYVQNIAASVEDLSINGAIEIPRSILTADDFYDWLHKE